MRLGLKRITAILFLILAGTVIILSIFILNFPRSYGTNGKANVNASQRVFKDTISLQSTYRNILTLATHTTGKIYIVSPLGNDNNDGSLESPFATIQRAANYATPGTTIRVLPGIYTTPLDTRISGTETAHITFISDSLWGAKITTTGADDSWRNTGDYVDIIGFDITGNGAWGISNQGSFVRIISNHIHNIPSPCTRNGGAGINNGNYRGHDDDIISNIVNDIGLPGVCLYVHGIYQANLRGHIWNNICFDNAGWGIHLWHAANAVIITNNLVFENRKGGITIGDGDAPGGITADSMIVANNIAMNNLGPGINEFGNTGTHNLYLNNLIFNNWEGIKLQNGDVAYGTIYSNPQFVNYQPDGSGNYHLKASSPAINAGTFNGAPTYDFEGNNRPQGKADDIGPFEYI